MERRRPSAALPQKPCFVQGPALQPETNFEINPISSSDPPRELLPTSGQESLAVLRAVRRGVDLDWPSEDPAASTWRRFKVIIAVPSFRCVVFGCRCLDCTCSEICSSSGSFSTRQDAGSLLLDFVNARSRIDDTDPCPACYSRISRTSRTLI